MPDRKDGGISRAARLRANVNADRKKNPHRYVEATDNVLFAENVAQMLGCTVDHVRTIPPSDLPRHREGKWYLYHRDDVETYVRRRGREASVADVQRQHLEADVSDAGDGYVMPSDRAKALNAKLRK